MVWNSTQVLLLSLKMPSWAQVVPSKATHLVRPIRLDLMDQWQAMGDMGILTFQVMAFNKANKVVAMEVVHPLSLVDMVLLNLDLTAGTYLVKLH